MFPLIFLFKRLQASFEKNMQEEKHPLWAFLTESLFENMCCFFFFSPWTPLISSSPPLPPFGVCSYGEHVQVPALPSHCLQGLQTQQGCSGETRYLLCFTELVPISAHVALLPAQGLGCPLPRHLVDPEPPEVPNHGVISEVSVATLAQPLQAQSGNL